jgi:hypothetical protein
MHGSGPTHLILPYSIYTLLSVDTIYRISSSTNPSHQNTQSPI